LSPATDAAAAHCNGVAFVNLVAAVGRVVYQDT